MPVPSCLITRAISGISASAWPRFMACDSCAISLLLSVSSTRGGAGIQRGIDGEDQHGVPANSEWRVATSKWVAAWLQTAIRHSLRDYSPLPSHRPDFDHVGHEMLQQVLDAVLQRRGG